MGHKEKVKDLQKTVLTHDELNKIVNDFVNHKVEDDFTISVTYDQIKERNYSLSAGQYFEVKIEYVDITQEEFDKMIDDFNKELEQFTKDTEEFQKEMSKTLKELKLK
ncbi:Type I restriction-modification system methyltransferase subunit (plasmid) [Mycoplasmopsis fermentans]|nr:Type I restriction-modification system methyltransferase subunit [Mycoplasmopsis fermentans]